MQLSRPGWKNALGELVFWAGVVALATWVLFEVFLPGVAQRRATQDWVRELEDTNTALKAERDRLAIRQQALEDGERTVYEQTARAFGFVPADRVRVVPPGTPPGPPPGHAPYGEPAHAPR